MNAAEASTDADGFVTAAEAAREVGHIRWWERRAASLLGEWARTSAHPASVTAWFDLSAHCAWRAERWADWAPRIAALDPSTLVVPRTAAEAELLEALEALSVESADVSLDTTRAERWHASVLSDHRSHLERLANRCDTSANRPLLRGILLSLADLDLDIERLGVLVVELRASADPGSV